MGMLICRPVNFLTKRSVVHIVDIERFGIDALRQRRRFKLHKLPGVNAFK